MTVEQQIWEQQWLPLWPLASDDLRHGIYRMSRESALQLRYIEANPHAVSNLLVVDIDHDDARVRALWERSGWHPNAIVENPVNGHAHAVWALREAGPTVRCADTGATLPDYTARSRCTYTRSTLNTVSLSAIQKPRQLPKVSGDGSPRNHACGATAQPYTKPHSPSFSTTADANL